MNSPADFDRFLRNLSERMAEDPANRLQVLQQEIAQINCPYLKAKLAQMDTTASPADCTFSLTPN